MMEALMFDAAISIVYGLPGHGKSLFLSRLMSLIPGTILTNVDLTPLHPRYRSIIRIGKDYNYPIAPEEILDHRGKVVGTTTSALADDAKMLTNCTYVIDEADLFFDSAEFGRFGKDYKYWLKRHRKRQQKLIFAVQDTGNLWNRIKRMTQKYIGCWHDYKTAAWYWDYLPVQCSRWCRAEFSNDGGKPGQLLRGSFEWWLSGREVFSWYRTSQLDFD